MALASCNAFHSFRILLHLRHRYPFPSIPGAPVEHCHIRCRDSRDHHEVRCPLAFKISDDGLAHELVMLVRRMTSPTACLFSWMYNSSSKTLANMQECPLIATVSGFVCRCNFFCATCLECWRGLNAPCCCCCCASLNFADVRCAAAIC